MHSQNLLQSKHVIAIRGPLAGNSAARFWLVQALSNSRHILARDLRDRRMSTDVRTHICIFIDKIKRILIFSIKKNLFSTC